MKINYNRLSNEDIEERYFMLRSGNYFAKKELPRILTEMTKRGMVI